MICRDTLGPINLIVRFETAEDGQPRGFVDSPDQNANGIPISEASYDNGKLVFRIASLGAEYTGDVAGDTITGE